MKNNKNHKIIEVEFFPPQHCPESITVAFSLRISIRIWITFSPIILSFFKTQNHIVNYFVKPINLLTHCYFNYCRKFYGPSIHFLCPRILRERHYWLLCETVTKSSGALWDDLVDKADNPTIFYNVEMANSKVSITSVQLH